MTAYRLLETANESDGGGKRQRVQRVEKLMTNVIYSSNLGFPRQNRKRERDRPRLMGHPQFTDSFQPRNGITDKNEMENERIN